MLNLFNDKFLVNCPCRLLKPGGVYMLVNLCLKVFLSCLISHFRLQSKIDFPAWTILQITYGDPTVRMPHINRSVYNWNIELYIIRKWFFPSIQVRIVSIYFKIILHIFMLIKASCIPCSLCFLLDQSLQDTYSTLW